MTDSKSNGLKTVAPGNKSNTIYEICWTKPCKHKVLHFVLGSNSYKWKIKQKNNTPVFNFKSRMKIQL